jgi:hypothetical protein
METQGTQYNPKENLEYQTDIIHIYLSIILRCPPCSHKHAQVFKSIYQSAVDNLKSVNRNALQGNTVPGVGRHFVKNLAEAGIEGKAIAFNFSLGSCS